MGTCRECIASSGGCCASVFIGGWKVILLPSEVARISRVTGKEPSEFVDNSALIPRQRDWYATGNIDEDPLWRYLLSLWTRPSGIKDFCPFLTPKGCSLACQSKPFACRVYPLHFNVTTGQIDLPKEMDCPACQGKKSVSEVLDYFGDDMGSLKAAFKAFRHECVSLIFMLERQYSLSMRALSH